jgi:hypothetical protein
MSTRDELMAALQRTAPHVVTDGILFHQAVADRLGLGVTDLRCLQILAEEGALTPGALAARTGLTTGAVTRLIDRLEQGGWVHRERDTRDRRKVAVRPDSERLGGLGPLYEGVGRGWAELLSRYDDDQLALVLDLFERMRALSRREAARLRTGA